MHTLDGSWTRRLTGALVLVAATFLAVEDVGAQTLPDGRKLADRYVELIGGQDAIMSRSFVVSTGQFQMPAMGISGEITTYQAQPGRKAVIVDVPGLGQIRSGFDGEVGYSLDPIQEPRLMVGTELDQAREDASFASAVRDPSLVTSIETVGQSMMNGEACWRVRLTWNSGRETYDCYSLQTGLMVGSTSIQESPMGAIEVTTLLSDYHEFDGFRIPTRITQQMMGQEQVMLIENVEFGNLDESVFALPPEIQALVVR